MAQKLSGKKFTESIRKNKINSYLRESIEYRLWREAVLKRDKYTCVWCGAKNGYWWNVKKYQKGKIMPIECQSNDKEQKIILHVDHIKKFSDYPELRFAIDNGRTLCFPCHKTTETYGNRRIIK